MAGRDPRLYAQLAIENALIRHITRFLLELGAGFAFVGQQFRLEVGGDEFFIDLFLYHTRLKCFVVVELKGVAFKPEHAGQLNFYLVTVDEQIKAPVVLGCLKLKTWQPCGFTPDITCVMVPSFPAASIA